MAENLLGKDLVSLGGDAGRGEKLEQENCGILLGNGVALTLGIILWIQLHFTRSKVFCCKHYDNLCVIISHRIFLQYFPPETAGEFSNFCQTKGQ